MAEQLEGLAGFSSWLRVRRMARENRVPCFLKWVQRFLVLARARPGDSCHDTLRAFLEDLEAGETPDWQLPQAADAVKLYCGQFLGAAGGRSIAGRIGLLPVRDCGGINEQADNRVVGRPGLPRITRKEGRNRGEDRRAGSKPLIPGSRYVEICYS